MGARAETQDNTYVENEITREHFSENCFSFFRTGKQLEKIKWSF